MSAREAYPTLRITGVGSKHLSTFAAGTTRWPTVNAVDCRNHGSPHVLAGHGPVGLFSGPCSGAYTDLLANLGLVARLGLTRRSETDSAFLEGNAEKRSAERQSWADALRRIRRLTWKGGALRLAGTNARLAWSQRIATVWPRWKNQRRNDRRPNRRWHDRHFGGPIRPSSRAIRAVTALSPKGNDAFVTSWPFSLSQLCSRRIWSARLSSAL